MTTKTFTAIGAAVGLATFLALGLLPALLYGGYAGVLLAGGILGSPLAPSFLARCIIVGGMVMGVTGVGALFTIGGSVVGAALGTLVSRQPASPELSHSEARARD